MKADVAQLQDCVRNPQIKIVAFDEITLPNDRCYLVKHLIPRAGLTVIWGPPKSGKSFWTFDLVMHVALDWEYRGRRIHHGPIVYCAFEGQAGVRNRCEAFRQKFLAEQAEAIPFYVVPVTLDLIRHHAALITAIRQRLDDAMPVCVVFDTLNRSLHGSESSDQDMGSYVHACDTVREAFDCAIIVVHHCGIDGTRPRGHTSLTGAVDTQIAVKRDKSGTIIATVEFMKDGEDGETIASRLEQVDLGLDEDGETITSCVVVPGEVPAASASGPRLTPNQRSMLSILDDAEPTGLLTDEWNKTAREEGIGVKRRATLMDLRKALKDKRMVHCYLDRWHVTRRA